MILWACCVCKRIARNLRANWNTAVQRGNAATNKLFKKEEVNREWYTPSNVFLTAWLQRLQPGEKCDEVTINCFNGLQPCEKAVETARAASRSRSTGLKPRC